MADLGAERVVDIYTGDACSGNPGPGGWGALLRYGTREKEIYGGEATATTNNRMELMAPDPSVESLTRPAVVRIHTDSTYVRGGITKWVPRWKRNGWLTTGKQPVKNADLWQRLDAPASRHQVQWHWVKGHAGTRTTKPPIGWRPRACERRVQRLRDHANPCRRIASPRHVSPRRSPSQPPQRCRDHANRSALPIAARPSGLCHVHESAVQCGAVKKKANGAPSPPTEDAAPSTKS